MLIPLVLVVVCIGSICVVGMSGDAQRRRQQQANRAWQQHVTALQSQPQPQAQVVPTFVPPPSGITANYADPENQRLAQIALGRARNAGTLLVVDAMVANTDEPTLTVSTLNSSSPSIETQAVSICMVLMNMETQLSAVSHFVINGAGGARLADGFRAQGRCYSASTSVWNRM